MFLYDQHGMLFIFYIFKNSTFNPNQTLIFYFIQLWNLADAPVVILIVFLLILTVFLLFFFFKSWSLSHQMKKKPPQLPNLLWIQVAVHAVSFDS